MKKLKVNFTSIERLMNQAETYNLEGQLKIDFEEALERMYRQKYIKVYGEKIPQELVRERLKKSATSILPVQITDCREKKVSYLYRTDRCG